MSRTILASLLVVLLSNVALAQGLVPVTVPDPAFPVATPVEDHFSGEIRGISVKTPQGEFQGSSYTVSGRGPAGVAYAAGGYQMALQRNASEEATGTAVLRAPDIHHHHHTTVTAVVRPVGVVRYVRPAYYYRPLCR